VNKIKRFFFPFTV